MILSLKPADWSMNAAAAFDRVDWDDTYSTKRLESDIAAERVELFAGCVDDRIVGWCALRRDGSELVILAAAGEFKPVNFFDFIPLIARQGMAWCESVRFHTSRPGMAHLAESHGFELAELVYRKGVHDALH